MKKIISLAVAVLTAVGFFPLTVFHSNAAQSGIFDYTVENGKATVVGISDASKEEITVPSVLGGYAVTEIGSRAFTETRAS